MVKDVDIGVEAVKGFTGKLGQAIVGFVGTVVFARVLGPTGLGGYYFLLTITHFVDRPIHGMALAVKKRYSEHGADEREVFGAMLSFGLLFVGLVGAVAFVLRERLRELTAVPDAWLVFTVLVGSVTVFQTVQKLLAGQGLVGVQTWNDTLRSVLTLPFQVAVVATTAITSDMPLGQLLIGEYERCVVETGAGSAGMGYGLAAATLAVVPVGLYYLRLTPRRPSWATVSSLWEFARYSILSSFVGKTQGRFDILVLGGFVGTAAIGAYEIADRLTVPALFLAGVATTGLMTKVSNRHSRDASFEEDIRNVRAYASLLAVPLFFGAAAIGDDVVRTFYGGSFADAAPILVGLAAAQLLTTQTKVYRTTLDGIDQPRASFRIDLGTLVVNVSLGLVLVFPLGVLGVVVATVVADAAKLVASAVAVRRRVGPIGAVPRPLQFQLLAGVVMGTVVELLRQFVISVTSVYWLLVLVGIGGVVYFGVLTAVSSHFRLTLTSTLASTVSDVWSE